jgi:ubiquinone/menaquinone biosynthesis C-methylase UbiE
MHGETQRDFVVTDLLTRITEQPQDVLDAIAHSMNVRASEPAMRSICARYLGRLAAPNADVLEIGCGNGAVTRLIIEHLRPARIVGIDVSPVFVKMAREALADEPSATFAVGEAAATRLPASAFDLVIAHTVFSHLVEPHAALSEAHRVLKPGGRLVICDGDFASLSVALFDGDPLQLAAGTVLRHMVHAPHIMRQLPSLVAAAGFTLESLEPHGYVQTTRPDYLLTLLSRGMNAAARAGEIGQTMVESVNAEARRRVANRTFFGSLSFLSLTALKEE